MRQIQVSCACAEPQACGYFGGQAGIESYSAATAVSTTKRDVIVVNYRPKMQIPHMVFICCPNACFVKKMVAVTVKTKRENPHGCWLRGKTANIGNFSKAVIPQ